MINANELSIGELFTFILYSVFIGASVGGMADIYAKLQKALGATEHLMDILDEKTENINSDCNGEAVKGNIHFNNLSFSYPSRPDVQVLNNINFEIKQGQNIALVGPSGAGKTTLASILFGFYKINEGEISVDGKNIDNYDLHFLRKQIAIVPQDIILFGGTIKENIAYGKLDATEQEIEDAAKKANALNFINDFPEKMETLVGERGIQLSGGQRQRIAIARALLKNPSILILDEATSALDSESEKLVQEAMDILMKGRTSIVIAHRLSTIKNADCILVLENGQIIEQGTHKELKENGGLYNQLSDMQFNH
jgi:ABC-type multidrug transport system fused ATPase/permease subunit